MKKFTSITAAMAMSFSLIPASPVFAAENIKVEIDGAAVDFAQYDNVTPYIENDYTLIPVRAIAENLGLTVDWDEATRTVTAKNDDTEITLVIDSTEAVVNGETKTIGVPARITDDRTFIPLRFVSENMCAAVDWIAETRTVVIETANTNGSVMSKVEPVLFNSSVTEGEQRMQIYTPAGYSKNKKYPVLYLINGGGTDDTAWVTGGNMQSIMDELISSGNAAEMIVVMPDG